jgi:hypothetical protein
MQADPEKQTSQRWICTPSNLWRPGLPTPVVHPAGHEVASRDGYPGGDIVSMRCDVCGTEWEMELAQ